MIALRHRIWLALGLVLSLVFTGVSPMAAFACMPSASAVAAVSQSDCEAMGSCCCPGEQSRVGADSDAGSSMSPASGCGCAIQAPTRSEPADRSVVSPVVTFALVSEPPDYLFRAVEPGLQLPTPSDAAPRAAHRSSGPSRAPPACSQI